MNAPSLDVLRIQAEHIRQQAETLRVSPPYRDDLCNDCDDAFCEQMSRDYERERAADAPYHGRR